MEVDAGKKRERLLKWKAALTQTANLSGYHFNFRNEYEYEVIGKIVDDVSNKINRDRLHDGMMNDDDDDDIILLDRSHDC
ncbi:hypothetical protein P8452_55829 [Trifolium repens]|nr:hypothetical protein P8452_55829 [Trifolium repens]